MSETKKKSPKQIATAVERAVKTLSCVKSSAILMTQYDWFDRKEFDRIGFDEIIQKISDENGVSSEHVKRVLGDIYIAK